jgi:tRNA(Ile)-lysidine synthase
MSDCRYSDGIGAEEFAALMARLGPFEPRPRLAVGLSGGADSLALTLLLKDWVEQRQGSLLALTVDHGLRADSSAEARSVGAMCACLGIDHRTLVWRPEQGKGAVQARAREARYTLLTEASRGAGIFHLALAHHRDDQAETFLFRLSRSSGLIGLSAMPAVRCLAAVRLMRPLLGLPGARLRATLRSRGVEWIEDPSNLNPAFARTRLRGLLEKMTCDGLSAAQLCHAAQGLGAYRGEMEREAACLIATAVRLHSQGHATLDRSAFARGGWEARVLALASLLVALGGASRPPGRDALGRFTDYVAGDGTGASTLAGVRAVRRGAERVLLVREERHLERMGVVCGAPARWDNRFDVHVPTPSGPAPRKEAPPGKLWVGPLREDGWTALPATLRAAAKQVCPWPARVVLPALWDKLGLISQPHLGYVREDWSALARVELIFRPQRPLTRLFTLV